MSATTRLVNISTRSKVDRGDNAQIAGFVIGGTGNRTLLIRAAGPAMPAYGLTTAITDPVLTLYSSSGAITSNDNWGDTNAAAIASAAIKVGAFALTEGSKDAALLVTLPPGAYSAMVTTQAGVAPGLGMVEVYEVQ